MKLALCGYGRMGRAVEELAHETGEHEIVAISCRHRGEAFDPRTLKSADVVIDFTSGPAVRDHVRAYCDLKIDAVIGTTGWDMHDAGIRQQVEESGIGLVAGSNFSPGAQIFLRLVAAAAQQFSRLETYDVYGFEVHHGAKQDSPSGTAKTVVRTILDNFPVKTTPLFERSEGLVRPYELHFASVRGGHNPGRHEVIFDSPGDEVHLTHTARGRRGFAEGALLAAEYVHARPGYVLFEELFQSGGSYEV